MNTRSPILALVAAITLMVMIVAASPAPALTAGKMPSVALQSLDNPVFLPVVSSGAYTAANNDWTQFAHDAQHTGYTAQTVAAPWRWKWAWNGPTETGAVSAGKFRLPRQIQPVTGGFRVYVAAGTRGVFALNAATGAQIWNQNPGGEINSTVAYDPSGDALYVVSSNGHLYRLNAATGQTTGDFNSQRASSLPLPPAIHGERVYFSMGTWVYAINKSSMGEAWSYDAGSNVQTAPAVSPTSGLVVAVSQDLYVHALRIANGTRLWRVKPTPLGAGDPGDSAALAEANYAYPVIAEVHGLVFVRFRLNWQTLWKWSPWPTNNAQMRSNLISNPDQQALYALRLSDGGKAFVLNVGNGGWGDGGRMPMGPLPVIKRFSDGSEVAYVIMRGSPCKNTPCDGRYDAHFGELVLDGSTVAGFQAGDVRFMQNTFFPTDEMPFLSMSGDYLLGGHWMFGLAHRIVDRSPSRGASSGTPITTANLAHIIASESDAGLCNFSPSHYCPNYLLQDDDQRSIPAGFYIYHNQGAVYNQYWSSYASWVVSGSNVYYVSSDGAVIALESGSPTSQASASVESAPQPESAPAVIEQTLTYDQTAQYTGAIVTVEGEIKFEFNNGKELLLGFENPHAGAFKAMIRKADWGNFGVIPDDLYAPGQTVRVTGEVTWYQGDPVVYLTSPEQIEIITEP